MAMLEQLKLADATPKKDRSPAGRLRRKLLDALDLQIELAAADGAGTELKRTRQCWVGNGAGGKDLRDMPLRLRRWWWRDDARMKALGNAGLLHGERTARLPWLTPHIRKRRRRCRAVTLVDEDRHAR